jgi:hypothetical protein
LDKIDIRYLLTFCAGLLWMKVYLLMRLTSVVGPLIKTIFAMVHDIVMFFTLFTVVLVFFTCIGRLLFSDVDGFSHGFFRGFIYLFECALGNFAFSDFEDAMSGKVLGYMYLLIYLLVGMVVLINLLIAILSSTYAYYETRSKALYYDEIIKVTPIMEFDSEYGALISSVSPINGILILAIPFYEMAKNKKALNDFLLFVEFFPSAVFSTVLFLVINLALVPLTYLYCLIKKISLITRAKYKDRSNIILDLLVFIILGNLFLLILAFKDVIAFWRHLYTLDILNPNM